jgi:mono/diheme cytochrome c family protein
MISARMHRSTRILITILAAIAVASLAAACGTEKISVPKSDPNYASDLAGAQLFAQRCGGCHTFSAAGTRGSAANIRSAEAINGPNFNINCERPVDRVLYAIENGGFSGAYMPANVVVGQQAQEVAQFVARFSGRKAPLIPGQLNCQQRAIGTLLALPDPPAAK